MRKLKNKELKRLDVASFKKAAKTPIIIILDNVRSLHNVGAVFRTADAFLIQKIYLCGITATPPHPEIYKTALGASESVNWAYAENTLEVIEQLHKEQIHTVAVEQVEGANCLSQLKLNPQETYALVLGNEVNGVQQAVVDACQTAVVIPQFGTKHSLNISISAGVVVWEFWKQLST